MSETSLLLQPSKDPKRLQVLWGYLQHEILYLTWFLMEVALLTPFLGTVSPPVRSWSPELFLIWLLLLMYLPFNLARLMSLMDWPRSRQRLILATAVILVYVLSMRTLFYQPASVFDFSWISQFFGSMAEPGNVEWLRNLGWFILTMFIWWRGIRLIGKEFYIEKVGRRLRVGGLVIAPFLIWASFDRLPWSVVPFILLFFLVSLTAVALTRVEEIEKQQSGRSASLNPKWLLMVGTVALLVMLSTVLLTAMVSGEALLLVSGWLDPLWRALYAGGIVIFNTIFSLLTPVLEVVFGIISWVFSLFTPVVQEILDVVPNPFYGLLPAPEAIEPIQTEAGSRNGFKIINILLMIAIALVVTLALGRVYRKAEFADRDSEASRGTSASDTSSRMSFGQRLLNRLGLLYGWRTVASIRRIYQNMCRAAAVNGYPRAEAETPFEYLITLTKAWPENKSDTRLITEAYVKVRYGELPESTEELEALRQAWKRLEMVPPSAEKQKSEHKMELDSLN